MERIVGGLTQVFLNRRDWTASVGCKADTGWDKWLQSWSLCVAAAEPPWNSLCSIWCPSPLPALHMFLLKDLVMLEPTPNSFANKQMKCELCEMLNIKRCYGNKFESLNVKCVRLYALFLRTMPIWDWGVSRAAACTICSSQFLLRDAWNLGLVRLRSWPASASNMQKTAGGWRHRIASPRRAIKPQHSETSIILSHVVM